jgi:hypothetical protein
VNVTLRQHYPDALEDLTLTEEYFIAKSHPVGVVVKLRPGGQTSPYLLYFTLLPSASFHRFRADARAARVFQY